MSKELKRAVQIIKHGGVAAIPTETAYGFAADSMNARAIKKIYLIKGRSGRKPLPLIAASLSMVEKFFYLNQLEYQLARRYWPGPLTILLRPKKKFPKGLMRGAKKIAVRVSSGAIAAAISRALLRPITATSANISGRPELYSGKSVTMEFKDRACGPDFIFLGGRIARRKPSTILEVINGRIKVWRRGPIKI